MLNIQCRILTATIEKRLTRYKKPGELFFKYSEFLTAYPIPLYPIPYTQM